MTNNEKLAADICEKLSAVVFHKLPMPEAYELTLQALNAAHAEGYKQGAAREWLPIESAPKDGTAFDVWTKYGRVTNCVRCKQWGRIYAYCNESANYNNLIMDEPTHWMPLPTPPKEQTR